MNDQEAAKCIVEAYRRKGYPLDMGIGEVNIVNIEGMNEDWTLNANTPNEFNDLRVVLCFDNERKPFIAFKAEGTTEPGRYWTEHPMDARGAARVSFGYHKGAWIVGQHHAGSPNAHEALVQIGPIHFTRDLNKDFNRAGDKEYFDTVGINMHWGYDLSKKDLGTSSAGCLVVRSRDKHKQFMSLVKHDPRYVDSTAFRFSTALFDGREVVTKPVLVDADQGKLIAQEAIDLIVNAEVGSKAEYEARYEHPEWPGGQSGITIGIGYDVGAGVANKSQLYSDWGSVLKANELSYLQTAIGVTGQRAQVMLINSPAIRSIVVKWDDAMHVFEKVDIPRWYNTCKKVLPNWEKLNKDCKGALLSLAYNRGASFNGDPTNDRLREMVAIRQFMISENFAAIPAQIRSMKRLWVGHGLDGLLTRRDREAALFERGLNKPKTAESVGAGTVVAGGAGAAKGAHDAGYNWIVIAGIVVVTVIVAVMAYKMINRLRRTVNTQPA